MDFLTISIILFSNLFLQTSSFAETPPLSLNSRRTNPGDSCVCFPGGQSAILDFWDTQINSPERLVVYLYRDPNTKQIDVLIPGPVKQALIPNIPATIGDIIRTVTTETIASLFSIQPFVNNVNTPGKRIALKVGKIENVNPKPSYVDIINQLSPQNIRLDTRSPVNAPSWNYIEQPNLQRYSGQQSPPTFYPNGIYQQSDPQYPQYIYNKQPEQTQPYNLFNNYVEYQPNGNLKPETGTKSQNVFTWPPTRKPEPLSPTTVISKPSQTDPVFIKQNVYTPGNLDKYLTFEQWFIQQMATFQDAKLPQDIKAIDSDNLRSLVQTTLLANHMNIGSTGLITDADGTPINLKNLELRPILIGNPVEYYKYLQGNQQLFLPQPSPYLEGILITLVYPPKILGIIPLGKTYVSEPIPGIPAVRRSNNGAPALIKHYNTAGGLGLGSSPDNISKPSTVTAQPYVNHHLNPVKSPSVVNQNAPHAVAPWLGATASLSSNVNSPLISGSGGVFASVRNPLFLEDPLSPLSGVWLRRSNKKPKKEKTNKIDKKHKKPKKEKPPKHAKKEKPPKHAKKEKPPKHAKKEKSPKPAKQGKACLNLPCSEEPNSSELNPKPESTPESNPIYESEPKQKPESKPESDPKQKPESKLEPKSNPKHESEPKQIPESKPESKPNQKPESKPQSGPKQKPESKPESKPNQTPESKLNQKPESKPNQKPELNSQSKPKPKLESKPESELSNKPSRRVGTQDPYPHSFDWDYYLNHNKPSPFQSKDGWKPILKAVPLVSSSSSPKITPNRKPGSSPIQNRWNIPSGNPWRYLPGPNSKPFSSAQHNASPYDDKWQYYSTKDSSAPQLTADHDDVKRFKYFSAEDSSERHLVLKPIEPKSKQKNYGKRKPNLVATPLDLNHNDGKWEYHPPQDSSAFELDSDGKWAAQVAAHSSSASADSSDDTDEVIDYEPFDPSFSQSVPPSDIHWQYIKPVSRQNGKIASSKSNLERYLDLDDRSGLGSPYWHPSTTSRPNTRRPKSPINNTRRILDSEEASSETDSEESEVKAKPDITDTAEVQGIHDVVIQNGTVGTPTRRVSSNFVQDVFKSLIELVLKNLSQGGGGPGGKRRMEGEPIDINTISSNHVEKTEGLEDDHPDFRIIGGSAATGSGSPLSNKGRSGLNLSFK